MAGEEMESLFGEPEGPYDELMNDLERRLEYLLTPIAYNTASIDRSIRGERRYFPM
jgi:hypothetical protein